MFRLTKDEFEILRCQIVTSSWGGRRYLPYAFTEQGVAMLSSVLRSKRAIQVNIQIMRIFTRLKWLLTTNEELRKKIEAIEKNFTSHDKQIQLIFEIIKQLLTPPELPEKPKRPIGFGKDQS